MTKFHAPPPAASGKEDTLFAARPAAPDGGPGSTGRVDWCLHHPAGWTRRQTLAALSASAAAAMLPIAAPAQPPLPPALAQICLRAVAAPFPARLGDAAARGRQIPELARMLISRLDIVAGTDWPAALCESGRRDIARGDIVEILGRPVMRTEAETLALGVLLLRDRALSDALT